MDTILIALAPGTLSSEQVARVRETAPDGVPVIVTRDRDEIGAVIDRVEVAAGWFPAELLPRASNLHWYQQWTAGADWPVKLAGVTAVPSAIKSISTSSARA